MKVNCTWQRRWKSLHSSWLLLSVRISLHFQVDFGFLAKWDYWRSGERHESCKDRIFSLSKT